jgi:Plasmid pRiA4b ORF-3-like protein
MVPRRETIGRRIYQVKITLKGIRPPIWRRVQVPGSIRLAGFHEVIQSVFGWTNTHLHQFLVDRTSYGQPDDFDEVMVDENTITLAQAVSTRIKRFEYTYDFGDNWEHEILVETIIGGDSGSERPLCLGGKRHRPPEDSGGPWGYQAFLEAIRDPDHEEHEARLEWVGGSFDSEAFDLAAVNHGLAALSERQWRVQ